MSSEQLCFGSPKITLSHSISLEGLGKVIRCSYGVRHSKGLEVTSQESGKALASENTGCGLLLSNPLLHPKTIRTSLGLQLSDQIVRHLSLQNYVSQYLKINLSFYQYLLKSFKFRCLLLQLNPFGDLCPFSSKAIEWIWMLGFLPDFWNQLMSMVKKKKNALFSGKGERD